MTQDIKIGTDLLLWGHETAPEAIVDPTVDLAIDEGEELYVLHFHTVMTNNPMRLRTIYDDLSVVASQIHDDESQHRFVVGYPSPNIARKAPLFGFGVSEQVPEQWQNKLHGWLVNLNYKRQSGPAIKYTGTQLVFIPTSDFIDRFAQTSA